jgi:hypothetical protein
MYEIEKCPEYHRFFGLDGKRKKTGTTDPTGRRI